MITTRDEANFKKELSDEMPNVLDMAIEFIKANAQPDDVFDDDVLGDWALNNGYVKEND